MNPLRLAALVTLVLFSPCNSGLFAAEGFPGNIRVIKAKGNVEHIDNTSKASAPLVEGEFVKQNHSVKTGAASTAILLFSNGSTVVIRPNSVFSMESFTQVPFDAASVQYKGLSKEPSVSQTKVSVKEGTVIASVAKLQKGSTMNISTPVGIAGIRGTIVQVSITRPGGGPQRVNISVPEGSVAFTALNGTTTTLSDGSTLTMSEAAPEAQPTQLTPQEAAEIEALINEALAQLPPEGAFDGVPDGSPETGGIGDAGEGQAGGFGGDQGAGDVGTAPGGGSSGGGGSATPTPIPTPNPPVS